MGNLGEIQRKVLSALLRLASNENIARTTHKEIAETMGWNGTGGSITSALELLEIKNYIAILGRGTYKVLV